MDLYTNRNSSSRFWPGRVIQKQMGEIDLRQEMHNLLFGAYNKPQRGHWMVYRRFDVTKKLPGYDDVYRVGAEVEPGQNRGPNFPYVDELFMTRMDPLFNPGLDESNIPAGVLPGGQYINYCEYNFKPYNYDQIFDIDWDDHTKKPPDSILNGKYERKYNIKEVFPLSCRWRKNRILDHL
jgi:hypothetical protein